LVAEWLVKVATVRGTVIEQRLRPLGYTSGHSILGEYLREMRPLPAKPARAFIRAEPAPGERFEVDWGHFARNPQYGLCAHAGVPCCGTGLQPRFGP
jgi:hypothetical protein